MLPRGSARNDAVQSAMTLILLLAVADPAAAQVPAACGVRCTTDARQHHGYSMGHRREDAFGHEKWSTGPGTGFTYGPALAGLPMPPPGAGGAGLWYECASPPGYYPYVTVCRTPWRAIPRHPFK